MHRLLLTSSAYRQASENTVCDGGEVDPENRLLWHFNRRRLEAEAIRDGILAVSGRLIPSGAARASSLRCPMTSPTSPATAAAVR